MAGERAFALALWSRCLENPHAASSAITTSVSSTWGSNPSTRPLRRSTEAGRSSPVSRPTTRRSPSRRTGPSPASSRPQLADLPDAKLWGIGSTGGYGPLTTPSSSPPSAAPAGRFGIPIPLMTTLTDQGRL